MKALVICGDSIADLVFSTPVIRALKVQLDDAEVHGLFPPSCAFLWEENPYIDKTHVFESSILKTWNSLKMEKFGLVVNLRTDWRSKILSRLTSGNVYSVESIFWKQWLMVNLKINQLPNLHLVDRMMMTLEPLGVKEDELGLDFFIPEKDKVSIDWLPSQFQKGFVVFAVSAPHHTRKLPVDKIIELCDKINKPIILLGMQEDFDTGAVVETFFARGMSVAWEEGLLALNKKTIVYNACGKFNFNQLASLVKQARAVFTFDNDFVPIASAFKKEIYGLWGNTILLFGRYPYRTKFTILESNSVTCRPCSASGI